MKAAQVVRLQPTPGELRPDSAGKTAFDGPVVPAQFLQPFKGSTKKDSSTPVEPGNKTIIRGRSWVKFHHTVYRILPRGVKAVTPSAPSETQYFWTQIVHPGLMANRAPGRALQS